MMGRAIADIAERHGGIGALAGMTGMGASPTPTLA